MTVMTPVGEFVFASCKSTLRVLVDARGDAVVAGSVFYGPKPCGDVRACAPPGSDSSEPWPGRLHADPDGGGRLTLAACWESCLGTMRGDLEVDLLERPRRDWAAQSAGAVGASGVEVPGRWTVTHYQLDVRPPT